MSSLTAIPLRKWIDEHRHLLKPPVGNQIVWKDRDFMVMIVGGPNQRKDYHVNPTEEFFHMIEGDMVLKIIEDGKPRDVEIQEGEVFLLPAGIPHSPQRPAGSIGMVVEHKRPEGANDHLVFFCEKCQNKLLDHEFYLTDLVKQLKPVIESFFADEDARTCDACGHVMVPPPPPAES